LIIYPNPVLNHLYIDLSGFISPIQMTLYNKIGEEILFKEINSSHSVINLPDIPSGLIILKIYYNEQYFYYKLLIAPPVITQVLIRGSGFFNGGFVVFIILYFYLLLKKN
jgi:hypothetical protein